MIITQVKNVSSKIKDKLLTTNVPIVKNSHTYDTQNFLISLFNQISGLVTILEILLVFIIILELYFSTEADFKKSNFVPFGGNLTQSGCQI